MDGRTVFRTATMNTFRCDSGTWGGMDGRTVSRTAAMNTFRCDSREGASLWEWEHNNNNNLYQHPQRPNL